MLLWCYKWPRQARSMISTISSLLQLLVACCSCSFSCQDATKCCRILLALLMLRSSKFWFLMQICWKQTDADGMYGYWQYTIETNWFTIKSMMVNWCISLGKTDADMLTIQLHSLELIIKFCLFCSAGCFGVRHPDRRATFILPTRTAVWASY